jgi:hypothetical protein
MDTSKLDWSLFSKQEKEISTINNEIYDLRKQKYPEYRDSYYRYYNEFGMRGMIGDLYRKFDRLKIMSESYGDTEIRSKEKEITDQFYDIISYCQLQLYWLRKEKWGKISNPYKHTSSDLYEVKQQNIEDILCGILEEIGPEVLFELIGEDVKERMGLYLSKSVLSSKDQFLRFCKMNPTYIDSCVIITTNSDGTRAWSINTEKLAALISDLEE